MNNLGIPFPRQFMNNTRKFETGDFFGGLASMLVALPSAIAFGLIIYSPMGAEGSAKGVISGILGAAILGIIAPIFGGTPRLITAPCAPAAAVLSVFGAEILSKGIITPEMLPLYISLVALGAGLLQIIAGVAKGGAFIKFIPYPVVAGYLSGVGILIILGQIPKVMGMQNVKTLSAFISNINSMQWESILIALVTMITMILAPKFTNKFPAPIFALGAGMGTYFSLSFFHPEFLKLENNPYIIGQISVSLPDVGRNIINNAGAVPDLKLETLNFLTVPMITLGVLLSIDTLKTCVVLDVLTGNRHNSNKELFGQGLGNVATAVCGGVAGAGTMGATLVNVFSGGKTKYSGLINGVLALLVLLFFSPIIAWVPYAALAGVLLIIGFRMIDQKSFKLMKHKSTIFDFLVILAVVISAVSLSLIAAAGVGIAFAIALFMREQVRFPVIRHKLLGNQTSSRKTRTPSEQKILSEKGKLVIAMELQGQLFFGTTDQLYKEIEPFLETCKYFILDMKRVLSIDFTAANMLAQIRKKIAERNGMLLFSSIPQTIPTGKNVVQYLDNLGFSTNDKELKFFPEMSDALEWTEDRLLRESKTEINDKPLLLEEFEFFLNASPKAMEKLYSKVQEVSLSRTEKVFSQGDRGGEIYFIRKGLIRIVVEANGKSLHRATFGKGAFFGDMSFLDREPRSADAVVAEDAELYMLRREDFDKLTLKYPEVAGVFYEKLSYQLSNRIRINVMEITNLEE